jgi:hypothetical protein
MGLPKPPCLRKRSFPPWSMLSARPPSCKPSSSGGLYPDLRPVRTVPSGPGGTALLSRMAETGSGPACLPPGPYGTGLAGLQHGRPSRRHWLPRGECSRPPRRRKKLCRRRSPAAPTPRTRLRYDGRSSAPSENGLHDTPHPPCNPIRVGAIHATNRRRPPPGQWFVKLRWTGSNERWDRRLACPGTAETAVPPQAVGQASRLSGDRRDGGPTFNRSWTDH